MGPFGPLSQAAISLPRTVEASHCPHLLMNVKLESREYLFLWSFV